LPRQSSMLVAQRGPVNPSTHVHANELEPSTHVAPFRHGLLLHSLMLLEQVVPE
jgi:hypothetical protein